MERVKSAREPRLSLNVRSFQSAISILSKYAASGANTSQLIEFAVRLVSKKLKIRDCNILELLPDGKELVPRAGSNSDNEPTMNLSVEEDSQASFVLRAKVPVIVDSFAAESRFRVDPVLRRSLSSSINLMIPSSRSAAYGILEVFSQRARRFTDAEIGFVQSMVELLSLAIDRNSLMEKLQELESRYRLIAECNQRGYFYVQDQNQVARYVSPTVRNVLGYQPEERVGHPVQDFLTGDPSDVISQSIISRLLNHGEPTGPYKAVMRHKDGHPVVLEVVEEPMLKDGIVVGLQGFATDVTALYETQQRLARSTEELQILASSSPVGVVVLDKDRRVTMCNPVFEEIFRYRSSEIVSQDLDSLITPASQVADAELFMDRAFSGETAHITGARRRKDGKSVEVEIHAVPVTHDGNIIGAYALFQDLTERKEIEQSLQRLSNRLLHLQDQERQWIARELHDNTAQNLAMLVMSLGELDQTNLNRGQRKSVAASIDLAEQFARELRTFSYLMHGPHSGNQGFVSSVRKYVTGFSRRSGIATELKISARLDHFPNPIETTIFRVLQESLANIYRHSGSRRAQIVIRHCPGRVILRVRDYGRGGHIPKRVHVPTSSYTSLGVGIAGMRERVEELGGQFDIRVGRGMIIEANLPFTSIS